MIFQSVTQAARRKKIRVPPTEVKPISAGPDLEIRGEGGMGGGRVLQKKKSGLSLV